MAAREAEWATPPEAAAYTGYKVPTLKNWRSQGKGPDFHRQGRSIRYRYADLDRWMTSDNPK